MHEIPMEQQQQQAAGLFAGILSKAERPNMFSRREGSLLRLVPANERLTDAQLHQQLLQLLAQSHMQQQLSEQLPACQRHRRPARHVIAWLRGCCYLAAGNSRQALRDARTAMAYATTAGNSTLAPAPVKPAPGTLAAEQHTDSVSLEAPAAAAAAATAAAQGSAQGCTWFPALLLAGQAYAALGDHADAVIHLAQAELVSPPWAATVVSSALQQAVRGLSPDQGYAWATGGLQGLAQQMQVEADLKLPEVLRPRPKWYYYNQWMKQRIHLTLLELHLASIMPPAHQSTQQLLSSSSSSSSSSGSSGAPVETSISSGRGRLLLSLLAEGGDEAPVVAAAAAAAGFQTGKPTGPALALPGAAAAAASKLDATADAGAAVLLASHDQSSSSSSSSSGSGGAGGLLQLPEPVVSKLLAMDAGDLDLMVQHPVALQGQVYELLDVLQNQGTEALQDYPIQPLTWEEVQGLAGPGVVGLPLGYTPTAALLPPTGGLKALPASPAGSETSHQPVGAATAAAAAAAAQLPAGPTTDRLGQTTTFCPAAAAALPGADTAKGLVAWDAGLSVSVGAMESNCVAQEATQRHAPSWRKPGWTRAQYVQDAVAAAQRGRSDL